MLRRSHCDGFGVAIPLTGSEPVATVGSWVVVYQKRVVPSLDNHLLVGEGKFKVSSISKCN
jgi:hypothetical protein